MNRPQLIGDAGRAWTFFSIHAMLVSAALGAFIAALPALAPYGIHVPERVMGLLVLLAAICGIIGRLVKQSPDDAQRIADLPAGAPNRDPNAG